MNYFEQSFLLVTVGYLVGGVLNIYCQDYMPSWLLHFVRYGKTNETVGKTGIVKKIEVPKSLFFTHFYVYAVFLQSIVLWNLICIYTDPNPTHAAADSTLVKIVNFIGGPHRAVTADSTTTVLAAFLFLIQVIRRLYECWFVSVFSGTKMNVLQYVITLLHYTGCSLSIIAHSVGFSSGSTLPPVSPNAWSLNFNSLNIFHVLGVVLFFYASKEQFRIHNQYAELRKGKGNQVQTLAHRIPHGGLFERLSCPNYWMEILIYASICVVFAGSNPTWNIVCIWVVCNQIILGTMNHKWYQRTFPDYPKARKAVIPYLW